MGFRVAKSGMGSAPVTRNLFARLISPPGADAEMPTWTGLEMWGAFASVIDLGFCLENLKAMMGFWAFSHQSLTAM